MKIVLPDFEILTKIDRHAIYKAIEVAGRVCYKSEDKITEDSGKDFVKMIIKRGHESVLEHSSISVKFLCNRGFTHEMVRHRLASFSQESTRYCDYGKDKFNKEITVVKPAWLEEGTLKYDRWVLAMSDCEKAYLRLSELGCSPQEARGVLPIDVKTEIVVTANLREWRHIFKLRCSDAAHPSMRELMIPLQYVLGTDLPEIFDYTTAGKSVFNRLKYNNYLDYQYGGKK